jgi:hypothetical protein
LSPRSNSIRILFKIGSYENFSHHQIDIFLVAYLMEVSTYRELIIPTHNQWDIIMNKKI